MKKITLEILFILFGISFITNNLAFGENQVKRNIVLDQEPVSSIFLTNAYDAIQLTFGYSFQSIYYPWEDRILFETQGMDIFKFNSSSAGNILVYLLRGVLYSSLAIDSADNLSDEAFKTKIKAEAYFYRAVCNFYLTICFDNPPLNPGIESFADKYNYPQPFIPGGNNDFFRAVPVISYTSPQADFFTSIQSDLEFSINNLRNDVDTENPWRPNKWSATAMLGKMYMFKQDFGNAKLNFEKVINSNVYELSMPQGSDSLDYIYAYLSNFSYLNLPNGLKTYKAEFNNESVFEVEYSDDYASSGWLPGVEIFGISGNLMSQFFSPHSASYKNIEFHPAMYDQFETSGISAGLSRDPRFYGTVYIDGDSMDFRSNSPYYKKFKSGLNSKSVALTRGLALPAGTKSVGIKKYYYPVYNEKNAPFNSPNNWRLIRYADVLLMYAEACYHLGKTDLGLEALNKVRARAGMEGISSLTPDAIIHERDVELAGECIRFHDLVRWSNLETPWVDMNIIYNGVYEKSSNEYLPFSITTGISNANIVNRHYSVYPVPTKGKVYFNYDNSPFRVVKTEVIDFTGRCVLTDFNTNQIDITHLPKGMYILRLTGETNDTCELVKIIKE